MQSSHGLLITFYVKITVSYNVACHLSSPFGQLSGRLIKAVYGKLVVLLLLLKSSLAY